ncbi:unnamed protein product [Closterium sp. Naga37s-1]|nr:unnamed protein product [Closterium sp. Naga37s-1]
MRGSRAASPRFAHIAVTLESTECRSHSSPFPAPPKVTFLLLPSSLPAPSLTVARPAGSSPPCVQTLSPPNASRQLASMRADSDGSLDYSRLVVELRTQEGMVKEQAHCAPNGYYFLPVYTQGTFELAVRGPPGWSFEPESVPVTVDGEACNGNKDVNFHHKGFGLAGKVLGPDSPSCAAQAKGPAGVTVTVTRAGSEGGEGKGVAEVVATAVTDGSGAFRFSDLLVGTYTLSASHPAWPIKLLGNPKVDLGWGSMELPDLFQVAGYSLSGSVEAQENPVPGKNPVPGVQIFLFSDSVQKIPTCPAGPGTSPLPGKTPLCHTTTGADGRFSFRELPCGAFSLVPQYKGEATVFEMAPKEMAVVVGHADAATAEPFQVRGFSVSGRVENSAGEGMEGATVLLLNGQPHAVTDAQGQYSLHQITSGQYALSATKPRYAFTPLPTVSIVPSASLLPPLRASHYELCVATLLDEGSAFQAGGRQVALTGGGGEQDVSPQAKKTDADGRVCFMVPPGTYQLAPHILPAEAAAGLAFAPSLATVTVTSAPVTGVSFNQSHLSVSGHVICIDGCDRSVRVSLARIGPLAGSADSASAAASAASASRSVFLKEKDGSFAFENVVPGKYKIEASKQVIQGSDMAGDEWCWKTQSADVAVSDSSVVGVALEQSGWRVEIDAAMEDTVSMAHGETALPAVKLKKGLQHMCVAASGSYSLRFPDSCAMYGEGEGVYYHTQEVKVIRLRPSAYKVSGLVRVNASLFPSAAAIAPHASARLFSPTNGSLLSLAPLSLVSAPNATHGVAVYAQEHWVEGGGELLLGWYHDGGVGDEGSTLDDVADALKSAHTSTLEQEEPQSGADSPPVFPPPRRLLFYPRSLKVQVSPLQCPPPLPPVDARPGLYLTGWLFPPLPRVNVSVVADADSANSGWQKGQVVMWAETVGRVRGVEGEGSAEGSGEGSVERSGEGSVERRQHGGMEGEVFVVGPLNDDATYHVELQKAGYVFKALGDNSFEAQKLASITVKIATSAETSTANEPLPSVLLSLTGDASFRRNEATLPGQNVFAFEGLFPGSYYLRPVLKEYEFSPAARPINLQSGQEVDVAFTAKRVAFSVLGSVRSLSGAPEASVQVEAREVVSGGGGSQSSHYEMAVTNEDGEYRLRGLRPGGAYLVEVAVRAGAAKDSTSLPRFERASPNQALLTITGDVPNVNFVVFNSPLGVTITGAVSGRDTAKWLPNLFVDLFPSVTVPASDNNEGTGTSSSSSSTNGAAAGADGSFEEASTLPVFSSTPIRSIPVPLSRFFEFRDLPRGMYLVKLRLGLPGKSHVFESEGREVDVREAVTAHAGTLRFRAEERRSNEDLAPTPLLPVLLAIAVISVVASLPKLQQLAAGVAATGGTTPGSAAGDSSAAPGAAGGWGGSGAESRGKNEQDSLRLRKPSPSAVSPSAPRRRVSPVRAADGDSDVPAFKGFPPMQTRPAWYWRIAAVVPYLLPLCEAWIYSETAQSLFHFLFTYEQLCQPFLMLLGLLPSWFMLAYFFGAYLGVVRNNRWPHFLRFHVVTGMLLEIILQVVGTLNDWIPKSIYWGKIGAHFWLAIAVAFIFIVLECIWCAIRGTYADVPFISDAAYMQIPYE